MLSDTRSLYTPLVSGNKIRLHVNLDAARAANLTISSKLLRPAIIVAGGDQY